MANQGGLLFLGDIDDNGDYHFSFPVTLHDIVHTDKSLTLVFEYLERDLKQYMDDCGAILSMNNVKLFLFQVKNILLLIKLFPSLQKCSNVSHSL